MRLLFGIVLAAVYLSILWGPAFFIARQSQRAGHRAALRPLRFILPSQLAATFALMLVADGVGLRNPAGLFVAITAAVSVAGGAICKLLGWYCARRQG